MNEQYFTTNAPRSKFYDQYDENGNPLPVEEEYADVPTDPRAAMGQQISDAGRVPLFTNVPQDPANPNVTPANVVNTGSMVEKIPAKPDDRAVALASEISSFRKHLIDSLYGGKDLSQSTSASDSQKAAFQREMDQYTKMFADELTGGKGALVKVLGPDGIPIYVPRNQAVGAKAPSSTVNDPSKTFEKWADEDKNMAFQTKLITGKDPAFANRDSGSRNDFQREYNAFIRSKGLTAADVALIQSDYKAGDMSLKNMTKQEAPMSAFVLNINRQIGKLEDLYKNDDRVGLRLLDVPIRELKVRAKGSGLEATRASYLLEVSNEIGKLSSGSSASVQQLSDSAKEDWKKVHDPNLSLKELMTVLNATRDQANMRMATWRDAKEEVRNNIKNLGGGTTQQPTSPKFDMSQVVEQRVSKSGKKLFKLKDGSIVSE